MMSLVGRLLLLIALAMVPVVAAQLFTQSELRHERDTAARADAARYVRLVSSDAERVIEGIKSVLVAVTEIPFVRAVEQPLCSTYLAALAQHYPQIFNITLIDDGGTPVCANSPPVPGATATDRFYFREAMRLNEFVIGDYIVGRTIRAPQLPVALPFQTDAGRRFVISIGLNFEWLDEHFGSLALPPGARLWIADRNGIVIVAPSDRKLIGQPLPDTLQPARGPIEGTFERRDSDGDTQIVGFEPLSVPPVGLILAVELSQQQVAAAGNAASQRDLTVLMTSIMAAVGLACLGATRLVSRPLQILTRAAQQWTNGHHEVRTSLADRGSEIGRLGLAFDRMAEAVQSNQRALRGINDTLEQRVAERTAELSALNRQLEATMAERQAIEAALRQVQKMDAIGRLTGGIAHDFNNLLTAIGGSIELMFRAVPAPNERVLRYCNVGRDAVERATRLTHRLLAFARQQPLEMQTIDLNRLVHGMSELLTRTLGEDVEVRTALAEGLWPTRTDPVQLENALLNLAVNARDAMPTGGRLTIETANAVLDAAYAAAHPEVVAGEYAMLAVSDTGSGMSPETISRAFDPFFTTKPVDKGTGLGLSMIYGFAKQSGGHVKIYSEVGRGTTVKLYLPREAVAADAGNPPLPAEVPAVSARHGETILVVEDDDAVRALSTTFLRDLGYEVLAAQDADSALELLRQHAEVAVLFTDIVLTGGTDGRRLAAQAVRERPGLQVLFTTGYAPGAIIHGGILDPGVQFLPKPFTAEALGSKLRSILDGT